MRKILCLQVELGMQIKEQFQKQSITTLILKSIKHLKLKRVIKKKALKISSS